MKKPICKECEELGQKYTVPMPMYGTTTCMAFSGGHWDEDGKFIEGHDPNTTTFTYHCSNGHTWIESTGGY